MVRLVALVESHRAVVEVDTSFLRQGGTPFQFPQHGRMQGKGSLRPLEGSREAGGAAEEIGVIEHGSQGGDAVVTRSADPSARGCFQQSVAPGKCGKNRLRITDFTNCHGRFGRNDPGNHSLRMQRVGPLSRAIQADVTQNKEQGIAPGAFRRVAFGEAHLHATDVLLSFHFPAVTRHAALSNH